MRQFFIDRETGLRDFLLTGDERFLEPYERAREHLPRVLQDLESRLEGLPNQRARVEVLRELWRDWEGVAHRELELYRQGGDYLALVRVREGKRRMDAIRAQLDTIDSQELTLANRELESFSYSVSHDLRAPLRAVDGFSQALLEDEGERMTGQGRELLKRLRAAASRMGQLIDELLQLSRVSRTEPRRERVDLSALARGDARLLRVALENLLGNAWKFTSKRSEARIEFFSESHEGRTRYVVRDNGVGFDMEYADKLFSPFQRMHKVTVFPGTGIGLATVQRIVHWHRGLIEAQAAPGAGATFRFTLEETPP